MGVVLTCFSLVYHFSLLSPSLLETVRYRLKYYLRGPLNPNQPTNQQLLASDALSILVYHWVLCCRMTNRWFRQILTIYKTSSNINNHDFYVVMYDASAECSDVELVFAIFNAVCWHLALEQVFFMCRYTWISVSELSVL